MVWMVPVALLAIYLSVAGALYVFQRSILFVPDTTRPDAASVGLPALREIELVTSDGLRLLAWYVPPPDGRPVLAYFHGNGGNLGNRGRRIARFTAAGWGILMPEYRGYGGNEGQPSEAGFHLDAQAAMAFLRAQGFGANRIVVYGKSIGTGVAVRVASEQPVAALLLESPYTSITAIASRRYWFLPVGLLLKDPFETLSRMMRVRAPVLIMQGAHDDIVPPDLGRTLFDAAAEPKEIWVARDADHNNLMQFGAAETAIDFVARHLNVEQ